MHKGTSLRLSESGSREQQTTPDQSTGETPFSGVQGRIVIRRVNELGTHPSFNRHGLSVPIANISDVGSQAAPSLREPLVISQDQIILRGYAQWELARLQGRVTIPCIEYNLAEEEALHFLLQSHRRTHGLSDFARILVALDLEPWLHQKARLNQKAGGLKKGSSTLAKAARVDVRSEIASAAGVSTGNVTKVKQLVQTASPDLLQALRLGEVSIHRGWQWSKEAPHKQRQRLFQRQGEIGVRKTIRQLVSQHRPKETPSVLAIGDLLRFLREVDEDDADLVHIVVVEAPGNFIFITQEMCQGITPQRELTP
jgi:hypothetical protein